MSRKYIPPMFRNQVAMATTGMHLAAASGRPEAFISLLNEHPQWIRFRDMNGRTPLATAMYYGKCNVIDALFQCANLPDPTKREILGALGDHPLKIVEDGLRTRAIRGAVEFKKQRLVIQRKIFHMMVEYLGLKYARTHSGSLFAEMQASQY